MRIEDFKRILEEELFITDCYFSGFEMGYSLDVFIQEKYDLDKNGFIEYLVYAADIRTINDAKVYAKAVHNILVLHLQAFKVWNGR